MKGTKDFIIHLKDPYSDTFKLKGGLEIYGNVDFTAERQSNRNAKVIATPSLYETDIKEGYEVLIDASPLYRQIYEGTKQGYQNVLDKDKELFHIGQELIVCYRKDKNSEWIGFGENSLVQPVLENTEAPKTALLLPDAIGQKKFTGKVTMKYANQEINGLGVENGDIIHMNKLGGVQYWIAGEEFWWVRNCDLYAKQIA